MARVITTAIREDGKLEFTINGAGKLTFDPTAASVANRQRAELHGWTQRISDAAALARDSRTGQPASPGEKLAEMRKVATFYEAGGEEWSLRGTGEGGGGEEGLTIRALAEVQGLSPDAMRARVEQMAEKRGITVRAYLAKVRTAPAVREAMDRLRGAPAGDADEWLRELAAEEGEGE